MYDRQHLWYALPSGRVLCYPYAKLDSEGISYAKSAWKPAADATEWPRARLWKGLACENITQAAANDVLRNSLRQLDEEGYASIGHVHDEIIIQCKAEDGEAVKARMDEIMCKTPEWASGLPLDVEIKISTRYGK